MATTYTIYAEQLEEVTKRLDRIARKAARYSIPFAYKFTDESGNVFIWYASRPIDAENGMTLKATVKDHNERDGVKQTVLTRCKAVA